MNDKGVKLFVERSRAIDSISFVEGFINSISNKPKSFIADFEEIMSDRKKFTEACDFAERELMDVRKAAASAGAGTLWAGSNAKSGASSMSSMASANSKGISIIRENGKTILLPYLYSFGQNSRLLKTHHSPTSTTVVSIVTCSISNVY